MVPIIVGVTVAVAVAVLARLTHFDRDKSFYPTVLIVIASYYIVFACAAGQAVVQEASVAIVFSAAAVAAAMYWPMGVGVGILLHGVFDIFHNGVIDNLGVPPWWPAFCAAVDLTLGGWILLCGRMAGHADAK